MMNLQYTILALSATGSIIIIVLLLIVAGVIGYLTAWFYAKSVYKQVIKRLEEDKAALIEQVNALKGDVDKMNKTVDELHDKIKKLEDDASKKDAEIEELKKNNR
jgi:peptidoglycan hydrolase CwlO-like protein